MRQHSRAGSVLSVRQPPSRAGSSLSLKVPSRSASRASNKSNHSGKVSVRSEVKENGQLSARSAKENGQLSARPHHSQKSHKSSAVASKRSSIAPAPVENGDNAIAETNNKVNGDATTATAEVAG